ncbi:GGDEF domain-containing protein [Ferrimonas sp. YFM]|uniref:GGDEF domain-containing protein n=1 Tax=Ferrimonas sp. YFM TaxID=3028878 RepID=UPI002573D0E2|nr:GGDEF domain-containing protein [Ferrimonas sp. YFM]BDY04839.1 GGDEF domain-containing protein [Ferrimonas sp. YFM]
MARVQGDAPRPEWLRALLSKVGEEEHSPFWKTQYNGVVKTRARDRAIKVLMAVGLLTFIPLGLMNLSGDAPVLGSLLLLYGVLLTIECKTVLVHGKGVFGYLVMGLLLACVAISSVWVKGALASYWMFPVVTALVFFAPPKVSAASNLLIIVGVLFASLQSMEPKLAVRMVAALFIVAGVAHFVMTAILRLHAQLVQLSTHDSLTQALNRSQLDDHLTHSLRRDTERPASIALLDIDNFKNINDTYGHDVGDKVITQVVECINTHTRKHDLLFRVGGDEFLILFNDTQPTEAVRVADKLRLAIQSLTLGPGLSVSVSIGLKGAKGALEPRQWIRQADRALYRAKKAGRNQAVLADS